MTLQNWLNSICFQAKGDGGNMQQLHLNLVKFLRWELQDIMTIMTGQEVGRQLQV